MQLGFKYPEAGFEVVGDEKDGLLTRDCECEKAYIPEAYGTWNKKKSEEVDDDGPNEAWVPVDEIIEFLEKRISFGL